MPDVHIIQRNFGMQNANFGMQNANLQDFSIVQKYFGMQRGYQKCSKMSEVSIVKSEIKMQNNSYAPEFRPFKNESKFSEWPTLPNEEDLIVEVSQIFSNLNILHLYFYIFT